MSYFKIVFSKSSLNFTFILLETFYIIWFYNHIRSSLLLLVAFHLRFNIFNIALFPVTTSPEAVAIFIGIEFVVSLLLIRHLKPPHEQKRNEI